MSPIYRPSSGHCEGANATAAIPQYRSLGPMIVGEGGKRQQTNTEGKRRKGKGERKKQGSGIRGQGSGPVPVCVPVPMPERVAEIGDSH